MKKNETKLSWSKQVVFTLILLGLALLIGEVVLSWAIREQIMVKSADPATIYSLYENRSAVAYGPEYRVGVQTDSSGFRTCNFTDVPEPRQTLLILGDSFSEGWGVDCEKSFGGILQNDLNEASIRVVNGGVHGGTTSYYLLKARQLVPKLKPSIVIVQFFDNDLDDLAKIEPYLDFDTDGRIKSAHPPGLGFIPAGWLTRKIRELALYRLTKKVWSLSRGVPVPTKYYKPGREPKDKVLSHEQALEKFGGLQSIADLGTKYNGQFEFYKYKNLAGVKKDKKWNDYFTKMELYLDQLISETKNSNTNTRLVFLYIPAKEVFARGGITGQDPKNIRLALQDLRNSNPFYQLLAKVASKHHIDILDGQQILYKNAENLYFPGDAHLNARGHQVVADFLRQYLYRE